MVTQSTQEVQHVCLPMKTTSRHGRRKVRLLGGDKEDITGKPSSSEPMYKLRQSWQKIMNSPPEQLDVLGIKQCVVVSK